MEEQWLKMEDGYRSVQELQAETKDEQPMMSSQNEMEMYANDVQL